MLDISTVNQLLNRDEAPAITGGTSAGWQLTLQSRPATRRKRSRLPVDCLSKPSVSRS
jgi:hypothetical protein